MQPEPDTGEELICRFTDAAGLSGLIRSGKVLGVIAYGMAAEATVPIDMSVLDGQGFAEVWLAQSRVAVLHEAGLRIGLADGFLFGQADLGADRSIDDASRDVYDRIFACIRRHDHPHLLRTWNYLGRINEQVGPLERYRQFALGRGQAFDQAGLNVETSPAACALGTHDGGLSVAFLAARRPGRPVENPRQLSAYRYPAEHGPRSPTFSRGLLFGSGSETSFFLSGTASIVGHQTLHQGDPVAQVDEAIANINSVLREAGMSDVPARVRLKTYIRHPEDLPRIKPRVDAFLAAMPASDHEVRYLHADICRAELLVEIEGVWQALSARHG